MGWGGLIGAVAITGGCLMGSAAMAADWQVTALSGKAFRQDGTAWVAVTAGEPLALGNAVKTLGSGTLTLQRDGVTVTVGPNSQLRIQERLDGKFGKATDVMQGAGSAAVEVDPARHIYLDVATPYMAAVVKGTVFTVSTFRGYSETAVKRGRVSVIDLKNRLEADVTAGQTATAGETRPLSLSGPGTLATPKAFNGKVVVQRLDGSLTETINGAGKTVTSHAGGNSNGAGNSENSNAGGNAGGNGNSGNSNSGSGNNNAGGNSGGNSGGNGNSGNSNAGGKSK